MSRSIIHVAIVSGQALPNLIPALMEKPDKVYLACSATMLQRGAHTRLQRFLKKRDIATEIVGDAPEVGLEAIQQYALNLEDMIQRANPSAEVVLNITGGTKLMAMGFYSIFSTRTAHGIAPRIIYTDTVHRQIEQLPYAREQPPPAVAIPDVLDVPVYLEAQGFRYRSAVSDDEAWQKEAGNRKAACKYLAREVEKLSGFIAAINEHANNSLKQIPGSYEKYLSKQDQRFVSVPEGHWAKAMSQLATAGIIGWNEGEKAFRFPNAAAAQFLGGGWLEEYAWHVLRDEGLYDVRLGVTGLWDNTHKAQNEFDVLGCDGNRLLFIECKTLNFEGHDESGITYKLQSLGEAARGLFGQSWLLCARKPTDLLKERTGQAGIRVVTPGELADLRKLVQNWKTSVA